MSNERLTFQQQLAQSGNRKAVFIPVVVAAVCIIGQAVFTNYFPKSNTHAMYLVIALIALLTGMEAFMKNPSKLWRIVQISAFHLVSLVGFAFLLPTPTPYLLFMMLLAMVTYFDYGLRGTLFGQGSLFLLLTIRFFQIHGAHNSTQLSLYLVTWAITGVMTYYSIVYLNLSRDELKQVERTTAQVKVNEQRVESLINNITDGVISVDHLLRVTTYNAAALDILDVNINVKGKKITELFHPIDAEKHEIAFAELLKSTNTPTINRDLRLAYNDGSISNLFIGINPIYLGYGKEQNNGYTIILRDITREKSLEEERDEFISVVSHELRTPIAITEGNISNAELIAAKSEADKMIKDALKEAHTQVLFLADMINDLSTLSRAERGKLEVEVEKINVHDFMNELADNYRNQAKAKGLRLELELDPKLELLASSKLYVREILQNFITNAIKYTEKGSVTIGAKPDAKGVSFNVSDTGIGISKADQERVFDKFFRSEDFRTRQANGTGLGLYVTMKLTRLIHAEIDLHSELNKGSTFTILIPNLGDAKES